MEKIEKIVELDIDFDELDEDIFDETGVQIVSLVDEPAIKVDFLAFNEENCNGECVLKEVNLSYNDYPEGAKNNACRALKWAEENGWGSCGEATGKRRANQLCNGENRS